MGGATRQRGSVPSERTSPMAHRTRSPEPSAIADCLVCLGRRSRSLTRVRKNSPDRPGLHRGQCQDETGPRVDESTAKQTAFSGDFPETPVARSPLSPPSELHELTWSDLSHCLSELTYCLCLRDWFWSFRSHPVGVDVHFYMSPSVTGVVKHEVLGSHNHIHKLFFVWAEQQRKCLSFEEGTNMAAGVICF